MNNKGFTLMELLGVVVLLAIVSAIAIPSIGAITNTIKENMYDKKLTIIEEAAILYGEDNQEIIMDSDTSYDGASCKSIKVSDLIPEYVDKDTEEECLPTGNGCVTDPRNEKNYLDNLEIIIYYKNKRINAKVNKDNNLTCN